MSKTYDIIVCGGGPAGLVAAIAAARGGARTAIVEQYGYFGGAATNAFVLPISEFKFNDKLYIGGIPWEVVCRLKDMGGAVVQGPLGNITIDPELYKLCLQRMVLEAGIEPIMHSFVIGVNKGKNGISSVRIANKAGTYSIGAKVFIDATGDADVAFLAGMPMQEAADTLQPASMCWILASVDTDSEEVSSCMNMAVQGGANSCRAVRSALLEHGKDWGVENFGGPWFCTILHPGVVMVNMTRAKADICDAKGFAQAEFRLREDVFKYTDVLRKHFGFLKNAYVAATPVQAGVRESRRIKGVHTITAEEYLGACKYPDSISRGIHPVDIHAVKGASQKAEFLLKPSYIPYSAMIAEGFPNLIVAGRPISCDRAAFASLRVQASCMGIGQAAGVAAAMAVKEKRSVLEIDTNTLVNNLKNLGAVLD